MTTQTNNQTSELELVQGSAEWHDARNERIGGSDVAAILGISPYKSAYELMLEKLFGYKAKENANMRFGTDHEDEARAEFIAQTGIHVVPAVALGDWWISSADGVGEDCVVEIKVPNKQVFTMAKEGKIPDYYSCQLQWNMQRFGKRIGYFFCFQKTWNKESKTWHKDTAIVKVDADDAYFSHLEVMCMVFYEQWRRGEMPAPQEADHRLIEAEEWDDCAKRLIRIRARIAELEAEEKACKSELLDMAGGYNAVGGGIKITKSIRKGQVNYGAIPELQDIDLEQFRKESSEVWTINEA